MDDLNAEIERRQAIADAATPGPWKSRGPTFDTVNGPGIFGSVHWEDGLTMDAMRKTTAFIAHARTGYPQCLEALKLAVAALESGRLDKLEAMEALAAIKRALEAK